MDKWTAPYMGEKNEKANKLRKIYNLPGIYVIREKTTKQITYVGMSRSSVYNSLYRHFQSWDDRRQRRVVYGDRDAYEVKVIVCNKKWVTYMEQRMIKYFQPRDNIEMYEDNEPIRPNDTEMENIFGYVDCDECPF